MRLVAGSSDADRQYLIQWMSDHIDGSWHVREDETRLIYHLQINDDGTKEILACVAMERWTPSSCEMHVATDGTKRWASRTFFHELFKYVFIDCAKARINFLVRADNHKSLTMMKAVGCTRLCTLKDECGWDEDGILFEYHADDWKKSKWFKPPPSAKKQ